MQLSSLGDPDNALPLPPQYNVLCLEVLRCVTTAIGSLAAVLVSGPFVSEHEEALERWLGAGLFSGGFHFADDVMHPVGAAQRPAHEFIGSLLAKTPGGGPVLPSNRAFRLHAFCQLKAGSGAAAGGGARARRQQQAAAAFPHLESMYIIAALKHSGTWQVAEQVLGQLEAAGPDATGEDLAFPPQLAAIWAKVRVVHPPPFGAGCTLAAFLCNSVCVHMQAMQERNWLKTLKQSFRQVSDEVWVLL